MQIGMAKEGPGIIELGRAYNGGSLRIVFVGADGHEQPATLSSLTSLQKKPGDINVVMVIGTLDMEPAPLRVTIEFNLKTREGPVFTFPSEND